jgi:hypothetical protein
MGTWEHIKLRELPRHNALGFFCWGRSLKIHTEIKRELFAVPPSRYKVLPHLEGGSPLDQWIVPYET